MRSDRGLHVIPAAGVVGGNDQVITFFAYNCFDPVEKRHEEIIVEVIKKQADYTGLSARQVSGSGVGNIPHPVQNYLQSLSNFG
jgi:hypothetical protein